MLSQLNVVEVWGGSCPEDAHELVLAAMRKWRDRYGRLPSSYDWSRTHARRRGGQALERLRSGDWPAASVVTRLFGTWAVACDASGEPGGELPM